MKVLYFLFKKGDKKLLYYVSGIFFSHYKRKFTLKDTEVEKVSQLDCIGSGDKSQRRKKGPGSLAERKAQLTPRGRAA